MAVIHPKFRFLHVPKTGGTWVNHVMQRHYGKRVIVTRGAVQAHWNRWDCPGIGLFTFCFVRHPAEWYRSYWAYKQTKCAEGMDAWYDWGIDQFGCDDFNRWVTDVLKHDPGHYSRLLGMYAGPPSDEIDFVGKYENLTADLNRAMELAGVEDWNQEWGRMPAVNASTEGIKAEAQFTPATRNHLRRVERDAFERWEYL